MTTEVYLIRHAPSVPAGFLYGRTDVAADTSDMLGIGALAAAIGVVDVRVTSPAQRCQQTASALWPAASDVLVDERLWEQDFGDWDGRAYSDVPNLGQLSAGQLATHRPPGGESFEDVVQRVRPALRDLVARHDGKRIAVMTHAGVIRAVLATAMEAAGPALSFEVETLSVTHVRMLSDRSISVVRTNWQP